MPDDVNVMVPVRAALVVLAVTVAVTVLVPAAPEVGDRLSQVAESDAVQVAVEVTVSDVLVAVEPGFQVVGETVNDGV
jgi:hypothetical protein